MNIETINQIAFAEGWGLWHNASSPNMEINIERVDELGIFNNDVEAIEFVKRLASEGSFVHSEALKIVNK